MIDYTVTLGNLIEIVAIAGGGIGVMMKLSTNVGVLHASVKAIKEDVFGVQAEIKKIGDVLTKQASAEARLDAIDVRMGNFDQDLRELRHGDGWVLKK
jgi:outer membrane murein-binding lipoprotein Lpp